MYFRLNITPPTVTSQGGGKRLVIRGKRPLFFKDSRTVLAEDLLMRSLLPYKPAAPATGPVRLWIDIDFPWRKSEPKRVREAGWQWKTTRPDCSNLVKMIEDCMTRLGFWNDDAQIASLGVKKRWSEHPGIGIVVEELAQPERRGE